MRVVRWLQLVSHSRDIVASANQLSQSAWAGSANFPTSLTKVATEMLKTCNGSLARTPKGGGRSGVRPEIDNVVRCLERQDLALAGPQGCVAIGRPLGDEMVTRRRSSFVHDRMGFAILCSLFGKARESSLNCCRKSCKSPKMAKAPEKTSDPQAYFLPTGGSVFLALCPWPTTAVAVCSNALAFCMFYHFMDGFPGPTIR